MDQKAKPAEASGGFLINDSEKLLRLQFYLSNVTRFHPNLRRL
jgi:hypothetical protein